MGTINPQALPPQARLVASIREGRTKGGSITFAQDVSIGGRTLTVTLHYQPSTKCDQDTVKKDMEACIAKVITLATELGVGTGGLEKIKITQDKVIGKWQHGDGPKIKKDMVEKLQDDITLAQGSPDRIQQIEGRLRAIQSISQAFSDSVQKPLLQISTEAAKYASMAKPEAPKIDKKQFFAVYNSALAVAAEIERAEKKKLLDLLNVMNTTATRLDELMASETASKEEIDQLRERLNLCSLECKMEFDQRQEELFSGLERDLIAMTTIYNHVVDERERLEAIGLPSDTPEIDRLRALEKSMQAKILECNALVGHTSLTTNAFTATKSHVMSFAAVVEKKLDLCERKIQLQSDPNTRKELRKIDEELSKAPTAETLAKSAEDIEEKLSKSSIQIVSAVEAKALHKAHPELKWGASHQNRALCTPANWTEVRTALIKRSRAGRMHVTVSFNKPLNIGKNGGVPAGLRADARYSERAANLMETTSYILSDDGDHIGEQISFRGAQFPTVQSAKEALVAMRESLEEHGQTLDSLHINALLTPTALTALKKDKLLLETHRQNILDALQELMDETDGDEHKRWESLRDTVAVSNFGVNEGAVGAQRFLGIRFRLGWHTSIADYTNAASQRLNISVSRKLEAIDALVDTDDLDAVSSQLDLLGPMLEVGQELEAVFASNDYADAEVGNNQFKMPALWKTMDRLAGVTCYTDCMSGKDRTGKVESGAQEYWDEISMNIADHKHRLSRAYQLLRVDLSEDNQRAWDDAEKVLTSACFKEDDLKKLHDLLQEKGPDVFRKAVHACVKEKIGTVRTGLGMERGPSGFMEEKRDIPRGVTMFGVRGIPTNRPKREIYPDAQTQFPHLAVSSMYSQRPIDSVAIPKKKRGELEGPLGDRQREAVNRRLSQLSGSLQITQINAGKPGFKVEGGEPLARFSSGFDREYVLYKLLTADASQPDFVFDLDEWMGLHEIDAATRLKYHNALYETANDKSLSEKQKIQSWTKVIREIEKDKMRSLAPQGKIKA